MIVAAEVPTWIGELAFGSVVLLALFGYVWFKPAVDELRGRAERAEGQRDTLIGTLTTDVNPAMASAAQAGLASADAIEKNKATLDRVEALLVRLEAKLDLQGGR